MRKVNLDQLGEMLGQPWLATLATYRRDGSVLLAPVWFEWTGTEFLVSVVRGDWKERHLRANPHAVLCIAEEETFPGRMVEASGGVTVEPDPGAEVIQRIATRYLGAELVRQWVDQYGSFEWEIMRMVPDRVRILDHRDEPFLREAKPQYLTKDFDPADASLDS